MSPPARHERFFLVDAGSARFIGDCRPAIDQRGPLGLAIEIASERPIAPRPHLAEFLASEEFRDSEDDVHLAFGFARDVEVVGVDATFDRRIRREVFAAVSARGNHEGKGNCSREHGQSVTMNRTGVTSTESHRPWRFVALEVA